MKQTIRIPLLISALAASFAACNNHENTDSTPAAGHQTEPPALHVGMTTATSPVVEGQPTQLSFTFKDDKGTVPLAVVHEKKVHLIIVNEELSWFHHLHPIAQADNSYTVTETFPGGDNYFLYTDFTPVGAAPTTDRKELKVNGEKKGMDADTSLGHLATVDGYTIRLEQAEALSTSRMQPLSFSIRYKGKELAAKELQTYLGASAHIVMIHEEDKSYVHIHPATSTQWPIYATSHIEKPGRYRMWVQFQTDNQVHTAAFSVYVKQGEDKHEAGTHSGHE